MGVNITDADIDYAFRMAQALGVSGISSSSTVAVAKRVAPIAAKYKIMWGGHGHNNVTDPEQFGNEESFEKIMEFGDYIGANLDVGHYNQTGADAVAFIQRHHDRITNVHIKDSTKPTQPDTVSNTLTPWGQGNAPIKAGASRLMRKEQYKFPANIEFEYAIPTGSDAILTEIAKCVDYARWLPRNVNYRAATVRERFPNGSSNAQNRARRLPNNRIAIAAHYLALTTTQIRPLPQTQHDTTFACPPISIFNCRHRTSLNLKLPPARCAIASIRRFRQFRRPRSRDGVHSPPGNSGHNIEHRAGFPSRQPSPPPAPRVRVHRVRSLQSRCRGCGRALTDCSGACAPSSTPGTPASCNTLAATEPSNKRRNVPYPCVSRADQIDRHYRGRNRQ